MTVPHLMNCPHTEAGWCSECVAELGNENWRLRDIARDAAEAATKHQADVLRLRTALKVTIDGKTYKAETELEHEAQSLLREVYGVLWTEAYYDPMCDATRDFAKPLAEKMTRLNQLMKFKE